MNKIKLERLLQHVIKVTGDVNFSDSEYTLKKLIDEYEFDHPLICAWIVEINAISEAVYGVNTLPMVVMRKDEESYLTITDVDGKLNFKPTSATSALLLAIHAAERLFKTSIGFPNEPVSAQEVIDNFARYSSQYDLRTVVSPIERSEIIFKENLQQIVVDIRNCLSNEADKSEEMEMLTATLESLDEQPADEIFAYENEVHNAQVEKPIIANDLDVFKI